MKSTRNRVLMVVENNYPSDIRVRKEAEALTAAGYAVSVIALRGVNQTAYEEHGGVFVYRLPRVELFEKTKDRKSTILVKLWRRALSIAGYAIEYVYFTFAAFLLSAYIGVRRGFDTLHTHNPPDTLSLLGVFYRVLGKKYVYDHHDLSPELYLTRFSGRKDVVYYGLLFFEKLSCRYSNAVISTNESYKRIEMQRHGIAAEKIFIVRNNPIVADCVSPEIETGQAASRLEKPNILFLGSINPQDGVDTLLQAIHCLVASFGEREFVCTIVGGGDSLASVRRQAVELGLAEYVNFTGYVSDRQAVRDYLSKSDIGVEPGPCNDANEHSTFIKVMEFMAAGKPVVAFDLKETRFSCQDAAVLVAPGDITGFAAALQRLLHDPEARAALGQKGRRRINEELNWEQSSRNLLQAYASLVAAGKEAAP
jgi:glycosyltransferase involved in cell wall biosynthesis